MKSIEQSSLFALCRGIADAVYGSLDSELPEAEAIRLPGELSTAIAIAILEDLHESMPEVAFTAVGAFFKSQGIADVGDGSKDPSLRNSGCLGPPI